MITAKAMGLKKGDMVFTGAFPGIIVADAHTATPVCEVWGFEHESGSVYASDCTIMAPSDWKEAVLRLGHAMPLRVYSKIAKDALGAAGIPFV